MILLKAHMTNGTLDFLMKLEDKHPNISFYFMTGSGGALAYYENSNAKIFNAGRTYEVIKNSGKIIEKGYVVMNTITVTDDDQAVFEDRIKNRVLDYLVGFQAFRFLKPVKGNKYVILTQWYSSTDYNLWRKSEHFQKIQQILHTKTPAYHNDLPFTTTYTIYEKDKEAN